MSRDKERLEKRYEIKKLSNPEKQVEAIVLEFDDPIARLAIGVWAETMYQKGYSQVARDTWDRLAATRVQE